MSPFFRSTKHGPQTKPLDMRSVLSLWKREYEEESKAKCVREVAADVTENGNYILVSAMPRNGMRLILIV